MDWPRASPRHPHKLAAALGGVAAAYDAAIAALVRRVAWTGASSRRGYRRSGGGWHSGSGTHALHNVFIYTAPGG